MWALSSPAPGPGRLRSTTHPASPPTAKPWANPPTPPWSWPWRHPGAPRAPPWSPRICPNEPQTPTATNNTPQTRPCKVPPEPESLLYQLQNVFYHSRSIPALSLFGPLRRGVRVLHCIKCCKIVWGWPPVGRLATHNFAEIIFECKDTVTYRGSGEPAILDPKIHPNTVQANPKPSPHGRWTSQDNP